MAPSRISHAAIMVDTPKTTPSGAPIKIALIRAMYDQQVMFDRAFAAADRFEEAVHRAQSSSSYPPGRGDDDEDE
jgi:hypothetical protein